MELPHLNYFDSAELHAWFENLRCPDCGRAGATGQIPGKGPHFGHVECLYCGKHFGWLPLPRQQADQKAHRPSRRPTLPASDDYCRICNIDAATARRLGRRMEWMHERDRAALIEAGLPPDDDVLIRACSRCHGKADAERFEIRTRIRALIDRDELTG